MVDLVPLPEGIDAAISYNANLTMGLFVLAIILWVSFRPS